MGSRNSIPGASGIAFIIAGTLITAEAITLVTKTYSHWPLIILGIVVALMAVASINK